MSAVLATRPIAVYGATGYTGRMVVAELRRRGLPIVLAGRSEHALQADARALGGDVVVRAAAVDDAPALQAAIAGCAVVINAAGPFSMTGQALLEAAIASGCHHVDTCADPFVMQACFELDAAARAADVIAVPGMSFYFALADLLAHELADGGPLDTVAIGYALDAWRMTRGSRSALWDMVGRRLAFTDGVFTAVPSDGSLGTYRFTGAARPEHVFAYPGGDVVTVPRHVATSNVTVAMTTRTFVPRWALPAWPVVLGIIGALARSRLAPALRRLASLWPRRDDAAARARTGFTVEIQVGGPAGTRASIIRGRDMYGLGAWIAADAAVRIARQEVTARGVLAPAQAFAAGPYLAALANHELIEHKHVEPSVRCATPSSPAVEARVCS